MLVSSTKMAIHDPPSAPYEPRARARLRILATTDTHGHLLAHDYIKDRPTQGTGLAALAPLIRRARADATAAGRTTVLLDNGDTFQGTPLARLLAERPVDADHGIVAALNALEYDAVGLGNHDLDHGMPYLRAVAKALHMPMVCTNLAGPDLAPLVPYTIVAARPVDADTPPLRVGVLSFLPTQTAQWHAHLLDGRKLAPQSDYLLGRVATRLRRAGADLIVVLAHMGVGRGDTSNPAVESAKRFAKTGIADALILGHVHNRLPSKTYAGWDGIDLESGTLCGIPAVMPGHAGSDLGIIDLDLQRDTEGRWRVVRHESVLAPHPPAATATPDPAIVSRVAPTHDRLRAHLGGRVARTKTPLRSHFTHAAPAPTQALVARAMYRLIATGLTDGPGTDLPVLAAVAAHSAGGRDGPQNFLDIAAGPILRRHVIGLNPFSNQIGAAIVTGAEVLAWLEHAAAVFRCVAPDGPALPLINDAVPGFQFDSIFGVTYAIDLTAAPYDRIRDLRSSQGPVTPDDRFVLAASQFRLSGGGGYATVPTERIVVAPRCGLDDALVAELRRPDQTAWTPPSPWHFVRHDRAQAILLTDPEAERHLEDIAHLSPHSLGQDDAGFLRVRLSL